jgi:FtsZ-interacting cell division protein ZipA
VTKTGEQAGATLIESGVIGCILVIAILALVLLVWHILKAAQRERDQFHHGLEVERERSIKTIKDFNEFQTQQNEMIEKVVQENRETRTAFEHALDKILSAIREQRL